MQTNKYICSFLERMKFIKTMNIQFSHLLSLWHLLVLENFKYFNKRESPALHSLKFSVNAFICIESVHSFQMWKLETNAVFTHNNVKIIYNTLMTNCTEDKKLTPSFDSFWTRGVWCYRNLPLLRKPRGLEITYTYLSLRKTEKTAILPLKY